MTISALLLSMITMGSVGIAGENGMQRLQKVLEKLRSGPGYHAKLVKQVHEGVQDKNTESSGEVYFAHGKMRMEFEKPEKMLMVYDGRFAWQEQEFDDGEKKRAIVTKMKADSLKKGSAVLAILLGDGKLLKSFELTAQKDSDGLTHFELRPRNKKITEVTRLELSLKGKTLESVSYNDDLENQVRFTFDQMKQEKVADKKFQYKPPKNAEVTNL